MFDVFNQQGIINRTSIDRYSARINLDMKVTDNFNASMSLTARRSETKQPALAPSGNSYAAIMSQAMLTYPFLLPYNADGEPIASYNTEGNGDNHPLAARDLSGQGITRGNTLDAQARINYDIPFVSGLKLSLDGAYKNLTIRLKPKDYHTMFKYIINKLKHGINNILVPEALVLQLSNNGLSKEKFSIYALKYISIKKIAKHEVSSLLFL